MKIEEKAKAKIIILHIVSDVPGITYHLLMDKCLASLTMDYFSFTECFNELLSSNLIESISETDGTGAVTADSTENLISITRGGSAVLEDIKTTLSVSTKKFLSDAKADLTAIMAQRNSIKASVEVIDDIIYAVLAINEDNMPSFKTLIRCENQEEASSLCSKWRKNAFSARDSLRASLDK